MIAGPGEPGAYEDARYAHVGDIRNSLRRFCAEARRGETALLRLGTGDVLAVGVIADDTAVWLDAFTDADGGELQHARHVPLFPHTRKNFPSQNPGGQGRTLSSGNVEL